MPITLLRSTAPHAGLAALSADLRAAVDALSKAQQAAIVYREAYPRMGERYLELPVAFELCKGRPWSDAVKMARQAIVETRGILHPDGRVSR